MRLDKLKTILEKRDTDYCIIFNRSNITYFTDFNAGLALSISKDETTLYVPRLEYDRALEELKGDINIAIKDWDEIERIMRAIKISEKAFSELLSYDLENLSERKIAAIIYKLILDYGGDDVAFKPIIASGSNTHKPHHEFSDRVVKRGDVLIIDFGTKYRNYCSDLTRTLCLGYIDGRVKDMYYAVLEAQKEAIKSVRHGIEASRIDEIARQVLREYGLHDHFIHGLGHGVGINIHEKPSINPCSEDILQEGNIITIEPGIYIRDNLGVRVEDMVLVEKSLGKVLTSLPRDVLLL
ncbi:MAG: hypothetical protein B6V02_00855 [Thermoprotei archaeon ex4572_64]|nr:MAG: hypothetical protein B6V02_00855 [Thermoprotei archaeon ex4572_64]